MSNKFTGGEIVAQTLRDLGVSTIFSVSGNQILPIYDATRDAGLRVIHMRHESAAAFAAAGCSEMSGQTGVLLTSAGPAFLAALTGVATVRSMELPLLFLSGASPVKNDGFGNFQELNQGAIARNVCKGSFDALSVESIPSAIRQAWRLSLEGIPGPVHVALPADVLLASGVVSVTSPTSPGDTVPKINQTFEFKAIADYLLSSFRPLLIARPSAARGENGELLYRLAAQLGIQAVVTGAPRALADSKYAHFVAHYKRSDCALIIAPSDYALGFLDRSIIASDGKVLLVDASGDPSPRHEPALHVQAPVSDLLNYLVKATAQCQIRDKEWSQLWLTPPVPESRPDSHDGAVHPLEVAAQIREFLQPDDVLAVDGGEFCQWIRLGLRDVPNRWLWNSKFGLIGNSIPMALGVASLHHPGRTIAIMGDGGAGYHLMEFETASRHGIPFVAIIGNDARWSAEWHIQVTRYGPDRTFDTDLLPAGYHEAASALGALGFQAENACSLRDSLRLALSADRPSCINVTVQSRRSPAVPP